MRRYAVLVLVVVATLTGMPAAPHGQAARGLPTLSSDLTRSHTGRVRVIVQADTTALGVLHGRLSHAWRRKLPGAVVLEVNPQELAELAADPSIGHISGDLPVAADMAMTNKVTGAEEVWEGTSSLLGLFGSSGVTGSGVGVAIVDSGIAPHSALGTRVVARVNFVSNEPGVGGDPFGHGRAAWCRRC